jgi:hypothetical protein
LVWQPKKNFNKHLDAVQFIKYVPVNWEDTKVPEVATYQATIYRDADNAEWQINPEAYTIERMTVTNKNKLNLRLAKGGGCAVSFIKQ